MSTPTLSPRYELLDALGEGGMGQVFRVRDRETGREVALKRLRLDALEDQRHARFLFKQEFWAMSSLKHPNMVEAIDYGEGPDGVPYMTMAIVSGADLTVDEAQTEDAVRAWLPQVASALSFLHGRGYVHGDLKPENVRLGIDGTARVMDLGLLAPTGQSGQPIRGSLAYMAPEVIKQAAIDRRADLYALGAVLYHALAGAPPFDFPTPMAMLRAHLERRPEPLKTRQPAVSEAMSQAVGKLLAKEPLARFSGVGDLLAALGLQSAGDDYAGLLASPVLGREPVQAALKAALATITEPVAQGPEVDTAHAQPVYLVGAAGSGKTRLLGELRADAQLAGVPTVAVAGLGLDAAPYQALLPLFRSLVPLAIADEPELAAVLARVLPELDMPPAPALDGVSERLRLQAAVVTLAGKVYPRAFFLVDEADNLDVASAELLAAMQRERTLPWAWILAQSAASGDEQKTVLTLEPLADAVIVAIAQQRLGQTDLPTGLSEVLLPLASGLPGTAETLLGHWLRTGAIKREAGTWVAAGTFAIPGGLHVALDGRLAELSADARLVAQVAAVLGASGDLRWLAGVLAAVETETALDDARFFAALRELVGVEVLAADEAAYRFVTPAQALTLAAAWSEEDHRTWHDRMADWCIGDRGGEPDGAAVTLADCLAIANHLLEGHIPQRAVAWVAGVAVRALALFTLEPAERLLSRTLALETLTPDDRLGLERLQANVWRMQFKSKDALAAYAEHNLLGRLTERQDPTVIEETINYGALLAMLGRYDEAKGVLEGAITLADEAGATTSSVRARIFAGRAAYFGGDAEMGRLHMAQAVTRGRAADAAGLPVNLAVALSYHGYFVATAGAVDEGLAALNEAVALAQAASNPVQTNEALSTLGNVCVAEGRLNEARQAFEAILETCQRFELPHYELTARVNLAAVQLEIGEIANARENAERVVTAAVESARKFPEAYARAVAGRARLHAGELAAGEAELKAGLAIAQAIKSRYLELHLMPLWLDALLALGRAEAAQTTLAEARAIASEIKNNEHDGQFERLEAQIVLQTAMGSFAPLAALAAAGEHLSGYAARLKTAGRKTDLAIALTLQGQWALRCGDLPAGTAYTDLAQKAANEAGLKLQQIEVAYLRARLAQEANLSAAALAGFTESGEQAEALGDIRLDLLSTAGALAAQGLHRERATIAKRFERLTHGLSDEDVTAFLEQPDLADVTRTLQPAGLSTAARDLLGLMASFDGDIDLPSLLKRAVATMVQFAGAERGFLLLFEDLNVTHQVLYRMEPDDADDFSASMAYEVLWTEKPMFIEDAQMDGFFSKQASVRALDLRSVVGVPLAADGKLLGVMIGDSQQITSGFGDYHLELVEALSRRVASAIASARRRLEDERKAALSALLGRVAIATMACADLESFMAPVAAEALALSGADRLCLVVGNDLVCKVAFDRDGRALPADEQLPSQSACRWVYETGEALHLHDVSTSETFGAKLSVMALGLRTIHAVPVSFNGKTLGVLYLDDRRVGREDPHITEALRQLGTLVGGLLTRLGMLT